MTAYLKAPELALFELAHARIKKDTGIDMSESELLNACLRCYSAYLARLTDPLRHDLLYREINVVTFQVPPRRDSQHTAKGNKQKSIPVPEFARDKVRGKPSPPTAAPGSH